MKLRTAMLAGIGLIGGAALLPLSASAQTAGSAAATGAGKPGAAESTNSPATNNAGVIHTPSSSGSASTMGAPGSTMGSNTAPSGSTMGSSGSTAMGSGSMGGTDDVSKLQQALIENGESLKVDGVMGPATQKALMDYQQKNGLQASGQLDSQTRQKLNLGG